MANGDQTYWVYAGAYASEDVAKSDFEAIKEAKHAGLIGKYQSALFTKEPGGKVKVLNTDSTTRTSGAKWGAAVGAVAGLLFPAGLLAGLVWGGGIGALAGNIGKGWYASDIKDLGDALDAGESGVILVAQATLDVAANRILKNAVKTEKKQVDADAEGIDDAVDTDA